MPRNITGAPRILYIGELGLGQTSSDRSAALARIGYDVTEISAHRRHSLAGRFAYKIASLWQTGPYVWQFNRHVRRAIQSERFDLLWLDKGWLVTPPTLRAARDHIGHIVLFNNDNPWGEHESGKYRQLIRCLPSVDVVIAPRRATDYHYLAAGATEVVHADFAFERTRHFPPDLDAIKLHDICFIGTAMRDGAGKRPHRTDVVRELIEALPGQVSVFGHGWGDALKDVDGARTVGGEQLGDRYREQIWASRVNVAFVTHDNWEESSHKAFEIAACGGCLLAERTERLTYSFKEDEEAVFFSSVGELKEKAHFLIANEGAARRIARAGQARCWADGYDNESRLAQAIASSQQLEDIRTWGPT